MSLGYINPYLMMGYCYLALVLFYLSHWQTYVTGKIYGVVLVYEFKQLFYRIVILCTTEIQLFII